MKPGRCLLAPNRVDITMPFTVENMRRVLSVIGPLQPRFYQSFGMPFGDRSAEQMAEFRNLYLETDLGIIDILGKVPHAALKSVT